MSNNYKAKIVKLKNIRPHSNADRLRIGSADGNSVIVGLESKEGDLGVYFPVESALSPEFLDANDLVARHDPETGKKIGSGYFGSNGRVKAVNLRGEKSEGFFTTLDSIYNLKADLHKSWVKLEEGEELDSVQGVPLCHKYINPATKAAMQKGNTLPANPYFHRHFDTEQLKRNMRDIPEGARLVISAKLHGSSGRLSYIPVKQKLTFWQKLFGSLAEIKYQHVIGSRNMIQGVAEEFNGEKFRLDSVKNLIGGINKGETLYYEIVGYEDTGKPIMPPVETKVLGKEYIKKYGDKMEFSYGCNFIPVFNAVTQTYDSLQNDIYVYRITQQNQDGKLLELTWDQMVGRCNQLGVKTVPLIDDMLFFGRYTSGDVIVNADSLQELADKYAEEEEVVGDQIREGVCVRYEYKGKMGILKNKNFLFLVGAGHIVSNPEYVDKEDIA